MTPAADLYARLLQPLRQTGTPYTVTGGLAAIIYGDPRLTNHVDIVLRLDPADAKQPCRISLRTIRSSGRTSFGGVGSVG